MNNEKVQEQTRDHLWMHFTRMGYFQEHDVPVITHGEGCYVYDTNGKKYLDGLAGLFATQVGHGRKEIAQAIAEQAADSHFSRFGAMRTRLQLNWLPESLNLLPAISIAFTSPQVGAKLWSQHGN